MGFISKLDAAALKLWSSTTGTPVPGRTYSCVRPWGPSRERVFQSRGGGREDGGGRVCRYAQRAAARPAYAPATVPPVTTRVRRRGEDDP
jgi:hypothetical protein